MDNWAKIGIALGTVLVFLRIIIHFVVRDRRKSHRKATLADAVMLLLAANGSVVGVKICAAVLFDFPIQALEPTYQFITGVALIWVSVVSMSACFRR